LLPRTKRKGKVRGPHKSMPYEELSAFMAALATKGCIGARMLETCILTCARINEIIAKTDVKADPLAHSRCKMLAGLRATPAIVHNMLDRSPIRSSTALR
jgi:hypothetical protein